MFTQADIVLAQLGELSLDTVVPGLLTISIEPGRVSLEVLILAQLVRVINSSDVSHALKFSCWMIEVCLQILIPACTHLDFLLLLEFFYLGLVVVLDRCLIVVFDRCRIIGFDRCHIVAFDRCYVAILDERNTVAIACIRESNQHLILNLLKKKRD